MEKLVLVVSDSKKTFADIQLVLDPQNVEMICASSVAVALWYPPSLDRFVVSLLFVTYPAFGGGLFIRNQTADSLPHLFLVYNIVKKLFDHREN